MTGGLIAAILVCMTTSDMTLPPSIQPIPAHEFEVLSKAAATRPFRRRVHETPSGGREHLAMNILDAIDLIKKTGGAVEIYGVRIEPCDERGQTATVKALDNALQVQQDRVVICDPRVTTSRIIAQIDHVHDLDGNCIKNRFGSREDCTARGPLG